MGNLAWEIIVIVFILVFYKFLPGITQSIKISREILKDNRDARGNERYPKIKTLFLRVSEGNIIWVL